MNGLQQLRTAKTISNIRGEDVFGPSYMEASKVVQVAPVEIAETSAKS